MWTIVEVEDGWSVDIVGFSLGSHVCVCVFVCVCVYVWCQVVHLFQKTIVSFFHSGLPGLFFVLSSIHDMVSALGILKKPTNPMTPINSHKVVNSCKNDLIVWRIQVLQLSIEIIEILPVWKCFYMFLHQTHQRCRNIEMYCSESLRPRPLCPAL